MDEPVIGRIRQIIDKSGEQQQVIAERIGIDPSKLTKSLSGLRRFTSLELAAWIAATALAENSVTTAGAHDR